VLVIYAVVATFGMVALAANSFVKFIALLVLVAVMMLSMAGLFVRDVRRRKRAGR